MRLLLSVIVATRNRRALLAQTLEALARQRRSKGGFEIVVADNGSTDGTRTAVMRAADRPDAPAIRYLFVAKPGKSHAVNAALDVARGDIIAFTDDDVRPDPDWLDAIVEALDQTGADFVAGRVRPVWETTPPPWMSPELYGVLAIPDNGPTRIDISCRRGDVMPIGANMAVRRAVVDRIGGLRTDLGKLEGSLRTGEDHEFFLRMLDAGYRGVYEPCAVVHHWVPAARLDRRYFRNWLYQNGRDVARLESSYPDTTRRFLGVPGHLWRQAASDACAAARGAFRGDSARRFAAAARLRWLAGYLRESWLGAIDGPRAVSG
jgi:glycosyltransferase involved in cell wall biosynthesis